MGTVLIEGTETTVFPRGAIQRKQIVSFWVKAWQGLGGAAAGSSAAVKYLLKQLEELAGNRDLQPAYIQWTASADPAATLNATELHDGWYIIDSLEPDYQNFVISGMVNTRMSVTYVAPAAPRRFSLWYSGAALSSNYSGAAINLLSLPVGSTATEANFTRSGGEGAIPCVSSPAASPEPVILSTTLANIYKGGVHVYDTINTSSNPVPVAGGTFVHANWVEVFGIDHDFVGDCVVTNGLQLLLLQGGAAGIVGYLWNTALAVANWQQYATQLAISSGVATIIRQYSLVRVGPEEVAVAVSLTTTAPQVTLWTLRLQRGRYEVRLDPRPLNAAIVGVDSVTLIGSVANKINYNSSKVTDQALNEGALTVIPTDYGYGAAFPASTVNPYILGFLYQNQPGQNQPGYISTNYLTHGDTTSLGINAQRSYGFFAVPYGVSGSYSTANLQAEAESGTLGTGWTSQANAAASAGNEAKCASGTASTNADLWGTAFVPAVGAYDLWVRLKVTSAASAVSQMQIGLWNSTDSSFVASTTYAPNAATTSYAWYRVATNVTPTATKSMRVRAVTTATTDTDWFLDESALVPKTQPNTNAGPQDIWQQFAYDRGVRWTRP